MDSILEKFYNGGNQFTRNGFTQFGALQSNQSKPVGLSHASKSPLPVRPMLNNTNNINSINHKPSLTVSTQFNNMLTNKDYLKPQKLAFNSSSDLLYNNNPGNAQRRYNSEYNLRNNTYADIKRDDTKMQMMEEKMKNLELKSQRLEVINDFFFDMFENNLVKEEINKQRKQAAKLQKQKNREEGYEVSSSSESESETESVSNNARKKNRKKKKKNLNLNTYDINNMKKKETFDPIKYQKSKLEYNKEVLDNIKKNVSDYLFEEELKKNEHLQAMGENINELKSKLIAKIERMEMVQKHQLEKVMFCLLNSGYCDDLPSHVFESPTRSPLDSRKHSIKRKVSMSNNNPLPNKTMILKHVGEEVIPEEKN